MKRLLLWAEGGKVTVSLSNLLDCLWPLLAAIHSLPPLWRMPVGVETCKTPVIPQWRNSDLFFLSLFLSLPAFDISLSHSLTFDQPFAFSNSSFWEPLFWYLLSPYSQHSFVSLAISITVWKGSLADREEICVKAAGDSKCGDGAGAGGTRPRHPV